MFETPKRPRIAVAVPDAPVRIRREPETEPEPESEPESEPVQKLPPLDVSEAEDEEDEAEEEAEDEDEVDEDQEVDEEDHKDQEVDEEDHKDQEDLLSKIVTFLKAPNTIPIAVLVGWTAFLTLKNYCSCP